MINMLRRAPVLAGVDDAILIAAVTPAFSQAPTDAQRSAIRSQCRSDYEAHCASVPPGGVASLQCLQKNMSSLSPGCQRAVTRRRSAGAAPRPRPRRLRPKAESARGRDRQAGGRDRGSGSRTAKRGGKVRSRRPVPRPKSRAAARSPQFAAPAAPTIRRICAGVPTGGAAGAAMPGKEQGESLGRLPAGRRTPPAAAAAPAAAPRRRLRRRQPRRGCAAAPATVLVLRPMRPREELFVLRSACGGDVRTLCGGVAPGGGRIMQCLAAQAASLSPACKDVLGQFRRNRTRVRRAGSLDPRQSVRRCQLVGLEESWPASRAESVCAQAPVVDAAAGGVRLDRDRGGHRHSRYRG